MLMHMPCSPFREGRRARSLYANPPALPPLPLALMSRFPGNTDVAGINDPPLLYFHYGFDFPHSPQHTL